MTASGRSPASTSSRAASAPRRRAAASAASRTSLLVLAVGTVLAGAAAFGPPVLARIGVVVALAAATGSWLGLWRELRTERRRHAAAMLAAAQASGQVLREERRRNAFVVDALTVRVQETAGALEREHGTTARLRSEVTGLRGERARLTRELWHRDADLAVLRDTLRARDTELAMLSAQDAARAGEADAEVHAMPRRVRAEVEGANGAGEGPAGVSTLPPGTVRRTLVLPNYEDDRRFA